MKSAWYDICDFRFAKFATQSEPLSKQGNSDVITIIFIFKWEIATSLMPLFLYSYIQMLLCSIVEIEFKRKSEIIQINM